MLLLLLFISGGEVDNALSRAKSFVQGRSLDTYVWENSVVETLPRLQRDLDKISAKVRMTVDKVAFLEDKLT